MHILLFKVGVSDFFLKAKHYFGHFCNISQILAADKKISRNKFYGIRDRPKIK